MNANDLEKTEIRIKLEKLDEEIKISWLKDQDRVHEFLELDSILEELLKKDTIEDYFKNNQSDFEYFINKFSSNVTNNILRQHYIYGPSGDDVAYHVLLQYLKIFNKFLHISRYAPLFDSIKEIFDCNKCYYRGMVYYNNGKTMNEKKHITAEQFNVIINIKNLLI
jgi:hypothetical protein